MEESGRAALGLAASVGHLEVTERLISSGVGGGADLEAVDASGRTALGLAVHGGHIKVANALRAAGAVATEGEVELLQLLQEVEVAEPSQGGEQQEKDEV